MIVAVMADKGGVGKTTAVHNLAAEFAASGPVLMVDADKQADLTELCGLGAEPNLGVDAILRHTPTPSAEAFIREVGPQLHLVGTHPQMRKADRELAQRTRREYVLQESLRTVRERYGVVIVDVGHSEMVQLNVLAVADVLVVPSTPAKLDADHISNMLDEAEVMRRDLQLPSLLQPKRVIVSLTRRSTNSGIEREGLALIRETFTDAVSPTTIPFTPRVIEASAMHLPLREYRDRFGRKEKVLSAAVDAYSELAEHVRSLAPAALGAA